MTFNSFQFALFLPTVWSLYWALPNRFRTFFLLAGSYVFYGAWDYRFLVLLISTTTMDFWIGQLLGATEDGRRRKRLLVASLIMNLTVLGFFKYFDFFVQSASGMLAQLGLPTDPTLLKLTLPVGISFYTFHEISYTVDVYRRRIEPCSHWPTFALFVAFFPLLVAGPIARARQLLPQLMEERYRPSIDRIFTACLLILLGLFKKVVLADPMAAVVDSAFSNAATASGITLALGLLAFSVQVYGDFSGYSDIARGTSRLFSVEVIKNFKEPYLSRSLTEFWRRWHVSLSRWLRDYVYIPLGGNRRGRMITYRNLMITMILAGFWHGAAWTFIAFGALHGLALIVDRLLKRTPPLDDELPSSVSEWMSALATFLFFTLTLAFFRAQTFTQAFRYLSGLVTFREGGFDQGNAALVIAALLLTFLIHVVRRRTSATRPVLTWRPALIGATGGAMIASIVVFSGQQAVPYVYFQF